MLEARVSALRLYGQYIFQETCASPKLIFRKLKSKKYTDLK